MLIMHTQVSWDRDSLFNKSTLLKEYRKDAAVLGVKDLLIQRNRTDPNPSTAKPSSFQS